MSSYISSSNTLTSAVNVENLAGDEGVFSNKIGSTLNFKSLTAGSNITLASDANAITIDAVAGGDVSGISTSANSGIPVYSGVTGKTIAWSGAYLTYVGLGDSLYLTSSPPTGGTAANVIVGGNTAGSLTSAFDNTFIGNGAGTTTTIEDGNVAIGKNATTVGFNDSVALGKDAAAYSSNQMVLGSSSIFEVVPAGAGVCQLGTNTSKTWTDINFEGRLYKNRSPLGILDWDGTAKNVSNASQLWLSAPASLIADSSTIFGLKAGTHYRINAFGVVASGSQTGSPQLQFATALYGITSTFDVDLPTGNLTFPDDTFVYTATIHIYSTSAYFINHNLRIITTTQGAHYEFNKQFRYTGVSTVAPTALTLTATTPNALNILYFESGFIERIM